MVLGHFLEINIDTPQGGVRAFMPREYGAGHKVGDEVGIALGRHLLFPPGRRDDGGIALRGRDGGCREERFQPALGPKSRGRGNRHEKKSVLCTVLVVAMAMIGVLPVRLGATKINLYSSGSDNVRIQWETLIEAFSKTNTDVTEVTAVHRLRDGHPDRPPEDDRGLERRPEGDRRRHHGRHRRERLMQIKSEASLDALVKLDREADPQLGRRPREVDRGARTRRWCTAAPRYSSPTTPRT